MRVLVIDVDERPRPVVITPSKGSVGDCTDETMVRLTDIPSILQRYGGNLAELARWRGTMSFGDQPPANLEDAIDVLRKAEEVVGSLPNAPFADLSDALNALRDGTFSERFAGKVDDKVDDNVDKGDVDEANKGEPKGE